MIGLTKLRKRRLDIGLIWAKYVNTWGQIGAVAGTVNFIMMLGVFYATTLKPAFNIPMWLYVLIVVVSAVLATTFVLRIGISGYYRFFSERSELSETNRRVKLIMNHLGIDEETTGK